MSRSKIVGIDLGTTNSCVAVVEDGTVRVLDGPARERTVPSVVSIAADGVVVGAAAVRGAVTNSATTVSGAKRLIGRKVNSPEIAAISRTLPYKLGPAPNGDAWIRLGGQIVSPQEVGAHVLRKLKDNAEASMGEVVTRAIITVPAYFDDMQRQATRDAGALAGLDVVRLLNEPTAAALAYGVHRVGKGRRMIAVFDLGGGTFDVTIMAVESGIFEVLATNGNSALGGHDWDRRIVETIMEEVHQSHQLDLSKDPVALARMREAAEAAKLMLSSEKSATISLPYLAAYPGGPLHYERVFSRDEVEQLTAGLLRQIEAPCRAALADAHRAPEDIDEVLLVGGMSRWPAVERLVQQIFGKKPSKGANPDEIVAMGAALYGAILDGVTDETTLLDVTPRDIGIRVGESQFIVLVPRNSMLPARAKRVFATTTDDQKFVAVDLYQGDSNNVGANRRLGQVVLDDLPPGRAGTVRVELELTIDVESLVSVTARELTTERATTTTIKPAGGLAKSDILEILQRRRSEQA